MGCSSPRGGLQPAERDLGLLLARGPGRGPLEVPLHGPPGTRIRNRCRAVLSVRGAIPSVSPVPPIDINSDARLTVDVDRAAPRAGRRTLIPPRQYSGECQHGSEEAPQQCSPFRGLDMHASPVFQAIGCKFGFLARRRALDGQHSAGPGRGRPELDDRPPGGAAPGALCSRTRCASFLGTFGGPPPTLARYVADHGSSIGHNPYRSVPRSGVIVSRATSSGRILSLSQRRHLISGTQSRTRRPFHPADTRRRIEPRRLTLRSVARMPSRRAEQQTLRFVASTASGATLRRSLTAFGSAIETSASRLLR